MVNEESCSREVGFPRALSGDEVEPFLNAIHKQIRYPIKFERIATAVIGERPGMLDDVAGPSTDRTAVIGSIFGERLVYAFGLYRDNHPQSEEYNGIKIAIPDCRGNPKAREANDFIIGGVKGAIDYFFSSKSS